MDVRPDNLRTKLLSWSRHRGLAEADAEDLVQTVLVTLLRADYWSLPEERKTAVAFGILRKQLALWYRSKAVHERSLHTSSQVKPVADPQEPLEILAASDTRDRLYKTMLATLDPIDVNILRARLVGSTPFPTIANTLRMPEPTVRQRYVRAILRLRAMLPEMS